jgi:hypothetical protein
LFARDVGQGRELVRVAIDGGATQPAAQFEKARVSALAFSPDEREARGRAEHAPERRGGDRRVLLRRLHCGP